MLKHKQKTTLAYEEPVYEVTITIHSHISGAPRTLASRRRIMNISIIDTGGVLMGQGCWQFVWKVLPRKITDCFFVYACTSHQTSTADSAVPHSESVDI